MRNAIAATLGAGRKIDSAIAIAGGHAVVIAKVAARNLRRAWVAGFERFHVAIAARTLDAARCAATIIAADVAIITGFAAAQVEVAIAAA